MVNRKVSDDDMPVGYVLKQAQAVLRQRMDDVLSAHGLSMAQYATLQALLDGQHTGAELARIAFVTPQTVQGLLDGLEKAGLVERAFSADHKRRRFARLTPQGVKQVTGAEATVVAIEQKMLSALKPQEVDTLKRLLKSCLSALNESVSGK